MRCYVKGSQRIEEDGVWELIQQSANTGDPTMHNFIDRHIEQGVQLGRATLLLRQIERLFGPSSDQAPQRVIQADPNTPPEWCERVVGANSLDNLLH